jgi:hypothetical protein
MNEDDKNNEPTPQYITPPGCQELKCEKCHFLNKEVFNLLNYLELTNNKEPVTEFNILFTCIDIMRNVEKIKDINGVQKKNLVLEVLNLYMKNTNSDLYLLKTVPDFIDSAISLEKGTLTIKNVVDIGTTCCFGFMKKSKEVKKI